jgi:pectate lyase
MPYPGQPHTVQAAVNSVASGNGTRVTIHIKPGTYYAYQLDPAANVPSLLKQYAGPQSDIGN